MTPEPMGNLNNMIKPVEETEVSPENLVDENVIDITAQVNELEALSVEGVNSELTESMMERSSLMDDVSADIEKKYIEDIGDTHEEKQKSENLESENSNVEGPQIMAPESPDILQALQEKLLEYRIRLGEEVKSNPYKAPELMTESIYKIAVLEKLLEDGKVDTYELSRELKEKYGGVNTDNFNNACGVIEGYARNGGKELTGGTGLNIKQAPVEKHSEDSNEHSDEGASSIEAIENQEKTIINEDVAGHFLTDLKIEVKDLESVEGFSDLSEGQQLMTLENLKQLLAGRIQEEASDAHESAFEEDKGKAGFLGKVWLGMKENFGGKAYDITKREKQTAEELIAGGIATHKDVLQQLVNGSLENGPEVEVNKETGELEVSHAKKIEGLNEGEQAKLDNFNHIGKNFANIPYEWSLESATDKQKEIYNSAKEDYDTAKSELFRVKEAHSEDSQEVFHYIAQTENSIHMNQFLNTDMDAEKKLMELQDQSVIMATLKHMKRNPNVIAAAGGFISRTIFVGTIGWIAAPFVGAAVGGYRGSQKANERLSELNNQSRRGKEQILAKDEKGLERNFVKLEGENGIKSKLSESLEELKNLDEKDINYTKKVNSLKARIRYTERKLNDGLVDFGKDGKRIQDQYELTKTLGVARGLVDVIKGEDENKEDKTNTAYRLKRLLDFRESNIDDVQSRYKNRKIRNAALIGAGFGLAGSAVSEITGSDEAFKTLDADEMIDNIEEILGATIDKTEFLGKIAHSSTVAYDEALAENGVGALFEGDAWEKGVDTFKKTMEGLPDQATTDIYNADQALYGESISNPAHTAEVENMIHSPIRLDDTVQANSAISINETVPTQPEAPKFEIRSVKVEASSRGAIQTFVDMKKELRDIYPDVGSRPPIVQKLLDQDAIVSAKEFGFYNPNAVNESSMLLKGETLRISDNGALEYVKNNGETITLEDGFDLNSVEGHWGDKGGKMFDYDEIKEVASNASLDASVINESLNEVGSIVEEIRIPASEDILLATQNAESVVKVHLNEMFGEESMFGKLKGEDSIVWKDLKERTVEEIMKKTDFVGDSDWDGLDDGGLDQPKIGFDDEETVMKTRGYIKALEQASQIRPLPNETLEAYMQRTHTSMELINVMQEDQVVGSSHVAAAAQKVSVAAKESLVAEPPQPEALVTEHIVNNNPSANSEEVLSRVNPVRSELQNSGEGISKTYEALPYGEGHYKGENGEFDATFKYKPNGNIDDVKIEIKRLPLFAEERIVDEVLQDGWKDMAKGQHVDMHALKRQATEIGQIDMILSSFKETTSPEYVALRKTLFFKEDNFTKIYGRILRRQ